MTRTRVTVSTSLVDGYVADRQLRLDPREDDEQQQRAHSGDEKQRLQSLPRHAAGQMPPDPYVHRYRVPPESSFGSLFATRGTTRPSTACTIIRWLAVNFGWQVVIVISFSIGFWPGWSGTGRMTADWLGLTISWPGMPSVPRSLRSPVCALPLTR